DQCGALLVVLVLSAGGGDGGVGYTKVVGKPGEQVVTAPVIIEPVELSAPLQLRHAGVRRLGDADTEERVGKRLDDVVRRPDAWELAPHRPRRRDCCQLIRSDLSGLPQLHS